MPTIEELRERLAWDTPLYCKHAVKIVDKAGRLGPLIARPAQLKLERALEAQRTSGRPQRGITLKSRKTGVSTWMQVKNLNRSSLTANHNALTVAQDRTTAAELFRISEVAHANLPPDEDLALKPVIRNARGGRLMVFGEPSVEARRQGHLGLNSSLHVDTAQEVEAGRGFTYRSLHLSEVAFWPDPRKLISLLNAVPDDPDTLIVLESTANGHNFFKDLWDRAEQGESDYAAVFIAWFEDPDCTQPFLDESERAAFIVGDGPYGAEEPDLVEKYGVTLEQLKWRRWAIVNRCNGELDTFHQEYPSNPDQAFLSSGRTVFDKTLIMRVRERVQTTDPKVPSPDNPGPERGVLKAGDTIIRRGDVAPVEVPTKPLWVPREATGFGPGHPYWKVWEHPVKAGTDENGEWTPPGQYVIACDPMSGEEAPDGELAWHSIQVIDHTTLAQVAEYRSRVDPDLLANELMLVGLYYNEGWLAVEMTGGFGLSINRKLWRDYRYRRMYTRKALDTKSERETFEKRLGWNTSLPTKNLLVDGGKEILRESPETIRSRLLAAEFLTFIKNKRGKLLPEPGKFADCLMAWLIAQQVAREKPRRSDRKPGQARSANTRSIRNPRAGY